MNRARDAASVLHRLPFPERPLVLRGCKVQDKSLGIELSRAEAGSVDQWSLSSWSLDRTD